MNNKPQANVRAVFFDDAGGTWVRLDHPVEITAAYRLDEVGQVLDYVEQTAAARALYAAGFVSYEAAPAFDSAFAAHPNGGFPLAWFVLYRDCAPVRLSRRYLSGAEFSSGWVPSLTAERYAADIAQIKRHLACGDSYQVNYTYRLRKAWTASAWSLFLHLLSAQHTRCASFIDTGRFAVCSASPELFFSRERNKLICRPMKGTAPRGIDLHDDTRQANALLLSAKNRAENMMIVDMIRNDMARTAEPGSVHVDDLFSLERYDTLWQMTSAISARSAAGLRALLTALFPCASISGCPKARTTEIIAALETSPRNIYTGCIGMLWPDGRMQFNVAIRTVTIDRQHSQAEYGVGGGITWDSTAAGEFEECRTKTLLLLQRPLRFSLLETILWTRADGYFLLPRHLQRLRESAAFFGFPLDLQVVLAALRRAAAKFPVEDVKVRLLLNARGALHLEHSAAPESTALLRVRLAAAPVQSSDQRLYHKTTDRSIYEEAQAACTDGSDVILWNEKGELTESANSNLVCELDGELVTPPLCCGLLPGTFRAQLLAEKKIKEGVVHRDDLSRVRRIYLINSVRLWREAALELLLESCANQVNVSPEFSPPTHSRPGQKTAAKSNNRRLPPQAEQTAAK